MVNLRKMKPKNIKLEIADLKKKKRKKLLI